MTVLENQILETWRIHHRITMYFLENIPEEGYNSTLSKRGGRDVARQWAPVHNVRAVRLKAIARKLGTKVSEFEKDVSPTKSELIEAFRHSGEIMEKYIQHSLENDGAVPNFQRGVVPMIGYYIAHEDHHLGHAILTMKQCGIKLPEPLRWNVWDWNKI